MSAETRGSGGKLAFRPDIQGLRALAVLLVIVAHLGGLGLPGGFIGVDVFFVVSGFLITLLLLRAVGRSGRLSLTDFYARRARRILPAATLVTVVTVVASILLLPLTRSQTVVTDSIWTSFFAANVRFAMVGTDYFAQGEPPSPFQHYWSLAVEEQFYVVWPLVVAGWALLWARRRAAAGTSETSRPGLASLGLVLGVLMALSVAWSVWATHDSPTTAYFSTFTRAWELGVGAACALVVHGGRLVLPRAVREVLGLGGLAAIAGSAMVMTDQTPFPGVAAAVPVLATAAIVLAGAGDGPVTLTSRLLSVRPAVVVGDWSYSLYLWHWPTIILFRGTFGAAALTLPLKGVLLVLMLVAAWASYRWVETPFRTGRTWRPQWRAVAIYPLSVVLVAGVATAGSGVITWRLGGFSDAPAISVADYRKDGLAKDPAVALVEASVLAAKDGHAVPSDLRPGLVGLRQAVAPLGDCDYRTGTTELCNEGDPDGDRSIVVIGDSHARAWSPAIHEIGRTEGYRSYALVYSGCNVSGLVQIDKTTGRPWPECQEFKDWALGELEELQPDVIVVSSSIGQYVDPATGDVVQPGDPRDVYLPVLEEGMERALESFEPLADRVVVLGNTPMLPRETGVCLSSGGVDLGDCLFKPGFRAQKFARTTFAAADEVGAEHVDARRWFCVAKECPSVVGDFITMRDKEHVTPEYAVELATPLAVALGLAPDAPGTAAAGGRE